LHALEYRIEPMDDRVCGVLLSRRIKSFGSNPLTAPPGLGVTATSRLIVRGGGAACLGRDQSEIKTLGHK
jgi:hypothetical protein